jgi:hypothetical protein
MGQPQRNRYKRNAQTAKAQKKNGKRTILTGGLLIVLVILGGLGIFFIIQQANSTSSSSSTANQSSASNSGITFSVTFSGAVSGPLSINTVNLCGPTQSTTEYNVDASGTINGTAYEFAIIIPQYKGPGNYSSTGNTATAAISLTNINESSQTWGSLGLQGSAIVNSDGQSGTISATIVNASQAQEQVSGTWACG